MLVINGTFHIDPARRADFIAACIAMQRPSQAEEGCHYYSFTADLEDESVFHIAEKWTDDEALKAHFAMPHMATFQKSIAGIIKSSAVLKYGVASEGPVF